MFFFFIGGINNEVRSVVEKAGARCVRCGSVADLVEYDKVFRAFFVPVWRWPAKEPAVHCPNCGLFLPGHVALPSPSHTPEAIPLDALRCWSCSADVNPGFKYCPHCGVALT